MEDALKARMFEARHTIVCSLTEKGSSLYSAFAYKNTTAAKSMSSFLKTLVSNRTILTQVRYLTSMCILFLRGNE